MYYEVIPARMFRQNSGILTYSSNLELKPGHIVQIPLGKTSTTGIVYQKVKTVNFKTKPISKLIYNTPLPSHLLKSILWLSEYYLVPLPVVTKMFLPAGIEKHRRVKNTVEKTLYIDSVPHIPLNPAQKTALNHLKGTTSHTKLLHGITGSGKTNIYLELAKNALKQQKSVILLVPEIALTSQLVQIFEHTFPGKTILMHSRQTESERHQIWQQILCPENEKNPSRIIIGPRSALFAPLSNLGLIIVDEAHESTFFQDNTPKYSTLRLASYIANQLKIDCIFGTATPLITDYHLAKAKNALVPLDSKAKSTTPPAISIIDLKNRQNFTKNRYFSDQLLQSITENLKNHHQTLIFHNRRGSAPLTICEKCGFEALCPTCFLPLTLHANDYTLRCHTCGHQESVPNCCPNCHHPSIIHKGFGTKLLENELKKLFKTAKIARFDADNNKTDSLDSLYQEVKSGNIDIIIGTQTIAKGLDLPNLATVGIVQADSGLSLPDYSAKERTFELITQVIGRVGRGHLQSTSVVIQTFQPTSDIITAAINSDYQTFATLALKERQKSHFPPFYYLAKLSITYKTEQITLQKIKLLYQKFQEIAIPSDIISTPTPAFHERTSRGYTWQITVRSHSRSHLVKILNQIQNLTPNLHIAIDPPSLL